MRFLIRVDGDPTIGGGHVMRCLTLADALREAGHDIAFAVAEAPGNLGPRILAAGYELHPLPCAPVPRLGHSPHAGWLSLPPDDDAARTAAVADRMQADWLIWDHYGLDADWVEAVRAVRPTLQVMAIDDLDDRPLASDMVLDQTRLGGVYTYPTPVALRGPTYALLRPDFAILREAALQNRGGAVRHILVMPGMMDAAGLAPLILDALADRTQITVEVIMSAASQSRADVEARLRPGVSLSLDVTDMAARMARADLCIGAGGMTSWERCCLGLPTLTIAVADNQRGVVAGLAEVGASLGLTLAEARHGDTLRQAIDATIAQAPDLSRTAAQLCDGRGPPRVVAALSGALRPLTLDDTDQMLAWRNRPDIVAVTGSQTRIDPATHRPWLGRELERGDAVWRVWQESGVDLGICGASETAPGVWTWSFYIGQAPAPKGAGGRMCAAFLRLLATTTDAATINATVRRENEPSLALHRRLGFQEVSSSDPAVLAFEVKTWDVRHQLRLPQEGPIQ